MPDDRTDQIPEDELNRLWNDLLEGKQDQHGYVLEDGFAQLLINLQTRGTGDLPGTARERAWGELLYRLDSHHHQKETSMNSLTSVTAVLPGSSSNGRAVAGLPVARPPVALKEARSRRMTLAAIAAATLVALAAAFGGYLLFGTGGSEDNPPPLIPAAVITDATPSPAVSIGTPVFQTVLSAEVMPSGDPLGSGLVHYTFVAIEGPFTWTPYCCEAPLIEFVVSGTYTVKANQPIQVIRSTGAIEEIPANEQVTLQSGDGLVSNHSTVVEYSNDNSQVELLEWMIVGDDQEGFNGRQPLGWSERSFEGIAVSNPPSSGLVRLWNVTLDPDESWTPPADSVVYRVTMPSNEEGTPTASTSTVKSDDGVVTNTSRHTVNVYILTLGSAETEAGTPTS